MSLQPGECRRAAKWAAFRENRRLLTFIAAALGAGLLAIGFARAADAPATLMEPYSRGLGRYAGPRHELVPEQLPAMADVHAPVIVAESPNNEANLIALPGDIVRCYYSGQHSALYLESTDGGLTWSEPRLAFTCEFADHFPRRVLRDRAGNLHCLFFDHDTNVYHTVQAGGRGDWREPAQVTPGHIGAIRNFTELRGGRLLFVYHRKVNERTSPTGSSATTAVYSDDGGRTWTESGDFVSAPVRPEFNGATYGCVEPTAIELDDGRLWTLCRTQTYRQYQSYSADGGATWTDGEPSIFTSSTSPSRLMRLSDGRLLLLWNNCRESEIRVFGKMYTNRTSLSAAVSDDDGRTWQGFREIYRDPARDSYQGITHGDSGTAYPNSTKNSADKVVFCTGQYDGLRAIGLFDADWLLETEQACDFSRGEADLETWHLYTFTKHTTKGVRRAGPELRSHPNDPHGHVLAMRRIDPHHGDAAVWNFSLGRAGRLELALLAESASAPVALSLTDHHRHPDDATAEDDALFTTVVGLGGEIALKSDHWTEVALEWDLGAGRCTVERNGVQVAQLPVQRATSTGACYLRLRSLAAEPNPAAVLLDRVTVRVEKNRTMANPRPE